MAIVEKNGSTFVEYEIPKDVDARIPEYFYMALAGELFSIFGRRLFGEPVQRQGKCGCMNTGTPLNGTTAMCLTVSWRRG